MFDGNEKFTYAWNLGQMGRTNCKLEKKKIIMRVDVHFAHSPIHINKFFILYWHHHFYV